MKKLLSLFAMFVLSATLALGQTGEPNPAANVATNNGQFTMSGKIVALSTDSGTVPVSDIGAMFAVTKNISLRSDNLIASGSTGQGFFGGVQYFLPSSKILAKTNFDPSTFQFYVTASGGVVRQTDSVTQHTSQHTGFLAGGGVNYDPTHAGKFSVNLVEIRAARLPGIATGVRPVVSAGINFGW